MYFQPLAEGQGHRVRRAAAAGAKETDAEGGMGHQELIAHVHAALIIGLRKPQNFIRLPEDLLINLLIRRGPAGGLAAAGEHHVEPEPRQGVAAAQYGLGSQQIKAQGAAAEKGAVALGIEVRNEMAQGGRQGGPLGSRKDAVAGETDRGLRRGAQGPGYESIFSTARNASLGTCTVPNWRIRFFPSFCFSSSFFFRVISPP